LDREFIRRLDNFLDQRNSHQRKCIIPESPAFQSRTGCMMRIKHLRSYGFHAADAIHITCAEKTQATFITTDKQILQTAGKNKHLLQCNVYHPTAWLMENNI